MNKILYWLTQNLSDVPEDDAWLSDGERSVLARMRFSKRRHDWRLGRWTAKLAIRAYRIGEPLLLSTLEIRAASDGAPEAFLGNLPANVSISISHSNDRGFCAVGPRDFTLGCDLERLEPREDFILDYFTSDEISLAGATPVVERSLCINLIWSAKEATLKTLREGLRRDTRSVCIRPDFRGGEGLWNTWTGHCLETSRVFYGWWRSCDGFIYTLASDQLTSAPEQLRI